MEQSKTLDHPHTLYEPTLLKRWAERYRDFEIDEAARGLRELRQAKDLFRKDVQKRFEAA